jgi:hypothetical protein
MSVLLQVRPDVIPSLGQPSTFTNVSHGVFLFACFEAGSHYVAQAGLKLTILLP